MIDLSISGHMFTEIVGGFFASIVAIIFGYKIFLNKAKQQLLKNSSTTNNYLSKKHSKVDILKSNHTFFQIGLVCSLGIVAAAFQWTTFEDQAIELDENYNILALDDDIPVVRTPKFERTKPIPIPKVTKRITPIIDLIDDTHDDVQFIPEEVMPVEINETTTIIAPEKPAKPTPKIETPKEPEIDVDPIVDVVEQMPLFSKTCLDEDDKNMCSNTKLLSFVHSKIKYPAIARENYIEGMVVIQFIIEKDGSITDPKIMKDIGGGCGQEALRVVKMMNKWLPGKQRGRLVRVRFNLPVKFKLQS